MTYKGSVLKMRNLAALKPGDGAVIDEINLKGGMRRRLLDIGMIPGTAVECVGESPAGDPKAFLVRGAVIAIRSEDCAGISVL